MTIPWPTFESGKKPPKVHVPKEKPFPAPFDTLNVDDLPHRSRWRGKYVQPDLMVIDGGPRLMESTCFLPWASMGACDVSTALADIGYDVGTFHETLSVCNKRVRYDGAAWSPEWAEKILDKVKPGSVLWYHIDQDRYIHKDLAKEQQQTEESFLMGLYKMHLEICQRIRPKHILVLGGKALSGMFGYTNPMDKTGIRYRYKLPVALEHLLTHPACPDSLKALADPEIVPVHQCPVDVDIDPGQIIADGAQKAFADRVRLNLTRTDDTAKAVMPELTLFHDFESAYKFLLWLKEERHPKLCYDLETSSLNPTANPDGNIVSAHFAWDTKHGYSVPIDHPEVPMTRGQQLMLLAALGDVLMTPRTWLIGHNLLFDNLCTRTNPHTGIGRRRLPAKLIDTMLLVYCLDEAGPRGLKENCNIFTPMKGYDDELDTYKKAHDIKCYRDFPWKLLGTYGGYDPVATLTLLEAVLDALTNREFSTVMDVAMHLMPVQAQALEDMAVNGQAIDLSLLETVNKEYLDRILGLEEEIHNLPEMVEFREICRQRKALEEAAVRMAKPMITQRVAIREKMFGDKKPDRHQKALLKEASKGFKDKEYTINPDLTVVGITNPDLKELVERLVVNHAADAYDDLEGYKVTLGGNGSQEIGDFFYQHLKIPVEVETDKGNPSLDYEAMEAIARYHTCAKTFAKYKDESKIQGTFFKPLVTAFDAYKQNVIPEYPVSPSGFTHFSIKVGTTVTGRTSGTYLQQAPAGVVKKLFVSRFKKGVIVQGDLSQVELRVLAAISGDPDMMHAYKNGGDLHTLTATKLFGERFINADPATKKKLRSGSKRVNFGLAYGIGAEGLVGTIKDEGVDCLVLGGLDPETVYADTERVLQDGLGRKPTRVEVEKAIHPMRVEICQKMLDDFFTAYPGVKRWVDNTHEFIKSNGWIPNVFGRIRRLPSGLNRLHRQLQNEAMRQGQNYPIQSAASDMMLVCTAAIEQEILERKLKALPWALVHDSSEFDSPLEEAAEVADIMLHYKRNPHLAFAKCCPELSMDWLTVPMEADVGIGPNWGIEYKYKDGEIQILSKEKKDPIDLWVPATSMWDALDDIRAGKYGPDVKVPL